MLKDCSNISVSVMTGKQRLKQIVPFAPVVNHTPTCIDAR
jgi:hypothetical protein